ncbi:MAG: urease accessory protein UreG [Chloroflexales bacterium]
MHHDSHSHEDEPVATPSTGRRGRIPRVGIGGPVGSGKTALIESLVPLLLKAGYPPLVITNDIVTREDAEHVRRTLAGILDPARVVGVETGTCPHTAVRDDPTMNMAAAAELEARYSDARILLLESGGDNLTLSFSKALVDYAIFVIDVAGGDKIPRKRGPGLIRADLLVINKTDLAPYVGASLEVMERDSRLVRGGRPFLFTNCRTGEGISAVLDMITRALLQMNQT